MLCIAPAQVFDADTGTVRDVYFVCAWINNDIRGVPNATCGRSPPCNVGACTYCKVPGGKYGGTSCVLPGAVRALAPDDTELRELYKEEFALLPAVASLADKTRPGRRTKASAIAAGNRVLTGQSKPNQEAFSDVDIYTTHLWYHDKIQHTLYDQAHQLANVMKQLLQLFRGKTVSKTGAKTIFFNAKRREFETVQLGRFPELKRNENPKKNEKTNPDPPWVVEDGRQDAIDALTKKLRVPTGWPRLRQMFKNCKSMKTAEVLMLAGPAGAYFLRLMGLDSDYTELFVELVYTVHKLMLKTSTPGDREQLEKDIPRLMTKLEMKLPLSWNTAVVHIFTFHALYNILVAGPFVDTNILDIERFHTLFKSLARGSVNVMASITNHYLILEASLLARLVEDTTDWVRLPAVSTAAGYAARHDSADKTDRMWLPKSPGPVYRIPFGDDVQQLQTLWADHYPEYREFHAKFNRTSRNRRYNKRKRGGEAVRAKDTIEEWTSPNITSNEKLWQKMPFAVKVHTHSQPTRDAHTYSRTLYRMCIRHVGYAHPTCRICDRLSDTHSIFRMSARLSDTYSIFRMSASDTSYMCPIVNNTSYICTCVCVLCVCRPITVSSSRGVCSARRHRRKRSRQTTRTFASTTKHQDHEVRYYPHLHRSSVCSCMRHIQEVPPGWWSRENGTNRWGPVWWRGRSWFVKIPPTVSTHLQSSSSWTIATRCLWRSGLTTR